MKTTSRPALQLSHSPAGPVSRARKQFHTLIKKLETSRALLDTWKQTLPTVLSKAEREFQPLQTAHAEGRKQLVLLFDTMHAHKLLGKREREKLSTLITTLAFDLLAEADDEVVKEIYNRHSGADFDADEEEEQGQVRAMMEAMLGTKLDDDIDVRSPEAVFKALQDQFAEQQDKAAAAEAQRRKRPSELARESRQAAEAQRLQQSMRDIFRKLASQLHPDRETDETERQRKTALMQRVNVAYAAKDMLGLLELQLEVEQIDEDRLAELGDERIKQYNKVLKEQLTEIETEIGGFVEMAAFEMGADAYARVTPASVLRALDRDIAGLRDAVAGVKADVALFADVAQLKAWLKTYRPPKPQRDDDLFW